MSWLRQLISRRHRFNELSDSIREHLEEKIADLMDHGMTREEAERAARREFGNVTLIEERSREVWQWPTLESIGADVKFASRQLRKAPGFTAAAVLTLALGIGANTAIFSLVNAVMLRSLPVRNPQQLVVAEWFAHQWPQVSTSIYGDCGPGPEKRSGGFSGCALPYSMYQAIEGRKDLFTSAMAFAGPVQMDLSGNGPASLAQGEVVSGNYFATLGVRTEVGRTLASNDGKPGASPVAVLDYAYWQRVFGGSPSVVGRTIRLNNVLFTIVGVADREFTRLTPGRSVDLWVPLTEVEPQGLPWSGYGSDTGWGLTVVGRLKPRISLSQAQAAVNVLFANVVLHGVKPPWKGADDPQLRLLPAQKGLVGIREDFGEPLLLLMAAVGIVLLIACANVAGLLLARSAAREKEMAVRLAIGAGRRRVLQQLLTESMLLSLIGAALGALLAYAGATGLAAFFAENSHSPLQIDLHLNAPVLLFAIGVMVVTGIGCGLAPAFRGARANVAGELRGSAATTTATRHGSRRRFGLGSELVMLQVALSMVVLTGAGLLLRTLDNLRSIDPGFNTRSVLLFSIEPERAGYKGQRIPELYAELQGRLEALPGVKSASYSSDAMLDGGLMTGEIHVQGQANGDTVESQILSVGPNFFATMGIPLRAGRMLRQADMGSGQHAAMVNEAFVRKFVGGKNPIGLNFGDGNPKSPQWKIEGVVGDTKYENLRSAEAPTAYLPLIGGGATFAVRTDASPAELMSAVRDLVNEADSNLPVIRMQTQSETIDRLLFNERLVARLFGLFGALALMLSCIGLYGLLSYEVAQRTREIGIRTALGAQRRDVWVLVLRQGLVLVLAGTATGIGIALGVTRLLKNLLYGVQPTDATTFVGVGGLLVIVGIAACLRPAHRAVSIDPMQALRIE
jgi:predicted permease